MQANIDYLLVGHITIDIVPNGRALGGTVSYAAPIAHAMGHRVGIMTSCAVGENLVAPLLEYTDLAIIGAQESTTFENIYNDGGRVQYVHELAKPIRYDDIPVGWTTAPLVQFSPLVEEINPMMAHQFPNSTVLLTLQGMLRKWGDDGRVYFKRWLDPEALKAIDIVVFSRQDIMEAPELEEEFAQVAQHLVVTNGDQGGIYYHNGVAHPYEAYPVEEIEPTGAGDVFATALLGSLLALDRDIPKAIQVAARLAALSVTRTNSQKAVLPEEVAQAIESVKGQ